MVKLKAKRPFRVGDRVATLYAYEGQPVGTFVMYCPGYLSHCMVRWSIDAPPARIAVNKLRLVVKEN